MMTPPHTTKPYRRTTSRQQLACTASLHTWLLYSPRRLMVPVMDRLMHRDTSPMPNGSPMAMAVCRAARNVDPDPMPARALVITNSTWESEKLNATYDSTVRTPPTTAVTAVP